MDPLGYLNSNPSRIGFKGRLYYADKKLRNHQNSIGNYNGPYDMGSPLRLGLPFAYKVRNPKTGPCFREACEDPPRKAQLETPKMM